MRCEKCGREHTAGGTYEFLYGKVISSQRVQSGSALEKKYNVTYQIAGRERAFICYICVALGFLRSGLGLSLLGIVVFLLVGVTQGGERGNPVQSKDALLLLGIGLVVGGMILMIFRSNNGGYAFKTFGDNQLIRAHRRQLSRQGHDVFLNRSQAVKLGLMTEAPATPKVAEPAKAPQVPAGPIHEAAGMCWYCGTRPPHSSALVEIIMRKEEEDHQTVQVPRCQHCRSLHQEVSKGTNWLLLIGFVAGTASCLLIWLLGNLWWLGLIVGIGLIAGGPVGASLREKAKLEAVGVKSGSIPSVMRFPEIAALQEDGWEVDEKQTAKLAQSTATRPGRD